MRTLRTPVNGCSRGFNAVGLRVASDPRVVASLHMRINSRSILLALAAIACSSSRREVGAANDDGGFATGRPRFDASVYGDGAPWEDPARVSLAQRVIDHFGSGDPIEGVLVCADGFDESEIPCVRSDGGGEYVLRGLPKRSELTVTFEKEGYVPTAMPWVSADRDTTVAIGHWLTRTEDFERMAPPGTIWDERLGVLEAAAWALNFPTGQPGVVLTSTPSAEPTYYNLDDTIASTGATTDGPVRFWNVPAGDYQVAFEHSEYDCEVGGIYVPSLRVQGYETGIDNTVQGRVLAGHLTRGFAMWCAYPRGGDAGR